MMPAHLPLVVGAGVTGALLFAAMLALGPLMGMVPGMLSPMPLVAAGLMLGWRGGVAAVGVAAVLVSLVGLSPAVGGVYLVSDGFPALLVLWLALSRAPGVPRPDSGRAGGPAGTQAGDWNPAGRILAWLALVPVLGLVVVAVGAAVTGQGFESLVREGVERLFDGVSAMTVGGTGASSGANGAVLDEATRQQAVDMLVSVLPGLLAVSWTVRAVLGGVLGLALAHRLGRRFGCWVRPRPQYTAVRLPLWYGVVFVVALLLAQVGGPIGYVAWAATLGLTLPFLLLGLKLVHLAVRKMPASGAVLAVFYVVFLSVSAIGYAAMVFVGLVEFATDLRKDAGGRSMEDE